MDKRRLDMEEEEQVKKYRSATITVVSNGFVITIGCQMVVAETPEKLKNLICDYLDDPRKAEKQLYATSISYGSNIPQPFVNDGRNMVERPWEERTYATEGRSI